MTRHVFSAFGNIISFERYLEYSVVTCHHTITDQARLKAVLRTI